jgi:DNA polymerase-4
MSAAGVDEGVGIDVHVGLVSAAGGSGVGAGAEVGGGPGSQVEVRGGSGAGGGGAGASGGGAIGTPPQVSWGEDCAAGFSSCQVGTDEGGDGASTGGVMIGNVLGERGGGS